MVDLSYFKPVHNQVARVHELVSWRLQTSEPTRWAMFLGSKISESILDGTTAQKFDLYLRWVKKLEQQLFSTADLNFNSAEYQSRLTSMLEVRAMQTL
jgi:hypothetical protein